MNNGTQRTTSELDDDAPVLRRCRHCSFSDELDEDGYCLLCSQTAHDSQEADAEIAWRKEHDRGAS